MGYGRAGGRSARRRVTRKYMGLAIVEGITLVASDVGLSEFVVRGSRSGCRR